MCFSSYACQGYGRAILNHASSFDLSLSTVGFFGITHTNASTYSETQTLAWLWYFYISFLSLVFLYSLSFSISKFSFFFSLALTSPLSTSLSFSLLAPSLFPPSLSTRLGGPPLLMIASSNVCRYLMFWRRSVKASQTGSPDLQANIFQPDDIR